MSRIKKYSLKGYSYNQIVQGTLRNFGRSVCYVLLQVLIVEL